jgi:hypothetical protein
VEGERQQWATCRAEEEAEEAERERRGRRREEEAERLQQRPTRDCQSQTGFTTDSGWAFL